MNKILLLFLCLYTIIGQSQTIGWFYNYPGAIDGYILFAPNSSDTTYLIDKCGKKIHTWHSNYNPGQAVYLIDDGTLLHTGNTNNTSFMGGGQGGILEKFDWDGNLLWQYPISDNNQCQHHDAIQLPNGNIVAIVWEYHTSSDAINNGRNPNNIGTKMWSEKIAEIQPSGSNGGTIVWQWRAWEHLIQDYDSNKPNYGVVTDHPELIDLNLGTLNSMTSDWLHCNGLDYNVQLDQLMVSCHNLNEVWIIDHSTTLSEAATHSGGTSGRGGDLMYRWGNPATYDRGTTTDQKFYGQHNPHWIPQGYPGGGTVMVFNNGVGRPGTDYSTVETFSLPAMVNNNYPIGASTAWEPTTQDWIYTANPPSSFFSQVISGAQRVENGNTIICEGVAGRFFEIDSSETDMWQYISPIDISGIMTQGDNPFMNSTFRCVYLPSDFPGFAGHDLTPGEPIELNPISYVCESNPTSVTSIASNNENVRVYPNPFHNYFSLDLPFDLNNGLLQIHDVTGRLVYEEKNFSSGSERLIVIPDYTGVLIVSVKDTFGSHVWNMTAVAQ